MSGSFSPVSPPEQAVAHPGYISGAWYSQLSSGSGTLNSAVVADTIYLFAVQVQRRAPFAAIGIRVGTASPGVLGKMALYDNDGGPVGSKNLIAEGVGTVDMNLSANTTLALNFAAPQTLNPGWYWIASLFNGAGMPATINVAGVYANGISQYVGASGPTGNTAAPFIRFTVPQAYSQGFPLRLGAATTSSSAPGSPVAALMAL